MGATFLPRLPACLPAPLGQTGCVRGRGADRAGRWPPPARAVKGSTLNLGPRGGTALIRVAPSRTPSLTACLCFHPKHALPECSGIQLSFGERGQALSPGSPQGREGRPARSCSFLPKHPSGRVSGGGGAVGRSSGWWWGSGYVGAQGPWSSTPGKPTGMVWGTSRFSLDSTHHLPRTLSLPLGTPPSAPVAPGLGQDPGQPISGLSSWPQGLASELVM